VRLVAERFDVELGQALECDYSAPGEYRAESPTGASVAAGTRLRSYLLHANSPDGAVRRLEGSVTFRAEVLGVIASRPFLDASDEIAGLPSVHYPTGGQWRGWFDGDRDDWISISPDRRTVSFRSHTGQWVDQMRILVRVADR
jgi:hypothetical protein